MDHAFGSSQPFTLGIEEELLLVDPETRRLAPVADRGARRRWTAHERAASHEVYAAGDRAALAARPDAEDACARARGAARCRGATPARR